MPMPTLVPGCHWVPRWRMMMLPGITASPPNFLTPRRRPAVSRPLRDEPPAFLCAMALAPYSLSALGAFFAAGFLAGFSAAVSSALALAVRAGLVSALAAFGLAARAGLAAGAASAAGALAGAAVLALLFAAGLAFGSASLVAA